MDMNEYSRKLRENVLFYAIWFAMEKSILSYSFEFFQIEFYRIRRGSRGGGPGGPCPPLTLGFDAPKLSIFGPYLIFP